MQCPSCSGTFIRSKGRKLIKHPALGVMVRRRLRCDTCSFTFVTAEIQNEVLETLLVDNIGNLSEIKKKALEIAGAITKIESSRAVAAGVASGMVSGGPDGR